MARRPEYPANMANIMTAEELKQLKRSLSMLSPYMVRDNYQKLLEKCRLREGALPTPRMMQELVTLWRVLWQCRK
jgi:hypothetical protein